MAKTRFEDFLDFAIRNEIEAARIYERSAAICIMAAQKQLLEKLATMERGHETILKQVRDGRSSSLLGQKAPRDLHLSDFLVETAISPDSPIEDVMVFSIKAEQKAYDLYSSLAKLEEDPETKALLLKLASEEKKHKFDLETQFEKGFMKEN